MTGPDEPTDAGEDVGDGQAGDATPGDEPCGDERPASDQRVSDDQGDPDERTPSPDAPAGGAPLEDLAAEVEQRRIGRGEREASEGDLFEEMDVGDVDVEAVWEDLVVDPEDRDVEGKEVGAGAEASRVDDPNGSDTRSAYAVPKYEFCGRCPYLSEPPELVCEHEGTDIVEVVDSGTFRVRGCPYAGDDEPGLQQYN